MRDLFGAEMTPDEVKAAKGVKRKDPIPSGHYCPKGTGPEGETCKTCRHCVRREGVQGHFLKCAKAKAKWTGGRKSDIRAHDAACKGWEAKPCTA